MDPAQSPRTCRPRLALGRARPGRATAPVSPPRQPPEKVAPPSARRDRVSVAIRRARSSASPLRPPLHPLLPRLFPRRVLRARRIALWCLRREFQLARTCLVPRQLPDHRIAAEVSPLLRRRLQSRMPVALGPLCHHQRSSERNRRSLVASLSARSIRPPPDARQLRQAAARPQFPRPHPVPRTFSL